MVLYIVILNFIKVLKGVVKKRNDMNLNKKKKLIIFFFEVRFCFLFVFWIVLFCFKFLELMDINIGKFFYKYMYVCVKWIIVFWFRY